VIAWTVSRDHFFVPRRLRRRTTWMAWAACGKASLAATAVAFMACAVMGTAGPVLFRAVELRIEGKKGVREPAGRFHRCVVPDAVEGDSSHVLGDLP
jgi:hypothetical protein